MILKCTPTRSVQDNNIMFFAYSTEPKICMYVVQRKYCTMTEYKLDEGRYSTHSQYRMDGPDKNLHGSMEYIILIPHAWLFV